MYSNEISDHHHEMCVRHVKRKHTQQEATTQQCINPKTEQKQSATQVGMTFIMLKTELINQRSVLMEQCTHSSTCDCARSLFARDICDGNRTGNIVSYRLRIVNVSGFDVNGISAQLIPS